MLTLFNSLTRTKEPFIPLQDKNVHLYVCGITPYDTTHLGHAFTYISFDFLVRFLKHSGFKVEYTQNVTDINDRDNDILKRAQEQHISWQDLSTYWTNKFLRDMKSLNWIFPNNYLKASEQIPSMITLIQSIVDNGFGYVEDGGVYLDITKTTDFGKLSKLSPEEMLERAKDFEEDLTNPHKKHPLDITLWRPSISTQPVHIPSFQSPWGQGRPGWHIECSAMSMSSLGEQIDIHGGGIDLIFPHHESEIAQSESATLKKPFAKYWLHTGTVRINGQKMSKSLGNLILISDLLKKYSSNAIRWMLLSHHYRKSWDYNEEELKKAEKIFELAKITSKSSQDKVKPTDKALEYKNKVEQFLSDDLQTPLVLQETEKELKNLTTPDKRLKQAIKETLTMLGFNFSSK